MLYDFLISQTLTDVYVGSMMVIAFMLAVFVAAPATVAFFMITFMTVRKFDRVQETLTSLSALCFTIVALVSLFFVGSKTLDLVQTKEIADQPIEQVYDVTKTGNQLFFNKKISNSSFIKDVSSEITNEDAENYTFVRHDHVYQIPKSIVTEK